MANILESAQAEATESALFLDVPEDRLDDGLTHFVNLVPLCGSQFVAHGLTRSGIVRWIAFLRRDQQVMLLPAGGYIEIDSFTCGSVTLASLQ